jgi:Pentapeptide repeats (8 copies)
MEYYSYVWEVGVMARVEQLKILLRGFSVWNEWRREHPESWIDLTRASLNGAILSEASFFGANLSSADL